MRSRVRRVWRPNEDDLSGMYAYCSWPLAQGPPAARDARATCHRAPRPTASRHRLVSENDLLTHARTCSRSRCPLPGPYRSGASPGSVPDGWRPARQAESDGRKTPPTPLDQRAGPRAPSPFSAKGSSGPQRRARAPHTPTRCPPQARIDRRAIPARRTSPHRESAEVCRLMIRRPSAGRPDAGPADALPRSRPLSRRSI